MIKVEDINFDEETEFYEIVKEMVLDKTVAKMRDIPQHGSTNCYDHCLRVSYYCYKICKKLNLDYISVARAGMVHDLYLYDWRKRENNRKGLHGFTHPKVACENAEKLFDLSQKEKDIILTHMWPLTIVPPKSIEGFIITLVDKYCATLEAAHFLSEKKVWRYAYLFLCFMFIKK